MDSAQVFAAFFFFWSNSWRETRCLCVTADRDVGTVRDVSRGTGGLRSCACEAEHTALRSGTRGSGWGRHTRRWSWTASSSARSLACSDDSPAQPPELVSSPFSMAATARPRTPAGERAGFTGTSTRAAPHVVGTRQRRSPGQRTYTSLSALLASWPDQRRRRGNGRASMIRHVEIYGRASQRIPFFRRRH